MLLNFIWVAVLLLFNHLDSLPKLYYYCCNKRDIHVSELRNFERTSIRVTKLKLDIVYFERCLNLKLCPKFLMFKPPRLKVYARIDNLKAEIIKNQIGLLRKELQTACNKYLKLKSKVKSKLTYLEFSILMKRLNRKCRMDSEETKKRHQKKLTNLWITQRTPAPDCLINISDKKLSIEEENSLRLGLKHHILPKRIDEIQIKTQVEQLWQFNKKTISCLIDSNTEANVKDEIKHATHSYLHSAKSVCGARINQNFHSTLKNLKSDPSIKVCSFDKGNGIVILNTNDYFDKLDKIIMDKSKFKEIFINPNLAHPVIRNENSIRDYLRKNVKDHISKKEFDVIYPSGSQPGKLYGLCKAHKPGHPLRPVVSMINTAEYHLAKFLDKIIKPHIPSEYMLNSSSGFLEKLKTFCFRPSDILVSFDVVSLFTNVPLNQTIDMIADHIYKQKSKPAFDKATFKHLMNIATSGIFMYHDKYFRQVDGVTMGSPLGPTIANFCLAQFESNLLESCHTAHKPSLYLRYVDDIFCVFRREALHEDFLDKLNALHQNLKFTSEIGPSTLPFLDTCITLPTKENESFTSSVYRKSTYTGLILNFSAICPNPWKFGLLQCFLHRAYIISSNWILFHKEVDFLKNIFMRNGYPEDMFLSCVQRFLNNVYNGKKRKIAEDKVETLFFVPYIGLPAIIYGKKLQKLLKENYNIHVRIVYTTFQVKNYFSLKSQTPLPLLANVVYQFKCLCDTNLTYIGKTSRHLATRVKEHSTKPSAIKDHLSTCRTCQQHYSCAKNFSVMGSGKNDYEITVKEAILIKSHKPNMNKQLATNGTSFMLKIF